MVQIFCRSWRAPVKQNCSENWGRESPNKPKPIIAHTYGNNAFWFIWRISAPVFWTILFDIPLFFTRFVICKNMSSNFSLQSVKKSAKLQSKGYHWLPKDVSFLVVYRLDGFFVQISVSGLIFHKFLNVFDEFRVFICRDTPGHLAILRHKGNIFSGMSIDFLKANSLGLPGA